MLDIPVIFIWGSGEGMCVWSKKIPTATGGVLSGKVYGFFDYIALYLILSVPLIPM